MQSGMFDVGILLSKGHHGALVLCSVISSSVGVQFDIFVVQKLHWIVIGSVLLFWNSPILASMVGLRPCTCVGMIVARRLASLSIGLLRKFSTY